MSATLDNNRLDPPLVKVFYHLSDKIFLLQLHELEIFKTPVFYEIVTKSPLFSIEKMLPGT